MIDLGGDVTTNGISKLVFTILSAVAEAERDRIRERIRDVKADQKKHSRYLGGTVPFGWTVGSDMKLVPEPRQSAAIEHARQLRREGWSLRVIAQALHDDHGMTISHIGVNKMPANESSGSKTIRQVSSQVKAGSVCLVVR